MICDVLSVVVWCGRYGGEQNIPLFFEQVPPDPSQLPVLAIKRGHISYQGWEGGRVLCWW